MARKILPPLAGWVVGCMIVYFLDGQSMPPGEYAILALKCGALGFTIAGVFALAAFLSKTPTETGN